MFSLKVVVFFCFAITKNAVQGQNSNLEPLTSESVSEGPCDPNISKRGARNINPFWAARSRTFFVPIASEACFRGYAEVLLGRPAESRTELESMKLKIQAVFPIPPIFVTYGFENETTKQSKKITQVCPPTNIRNQILCRPVPKFSSPGTNTSGITTSQDTTYYTDNNTTLLIIRCLNMRVKDYKVLSTGPRVNSATREIIISKITELGFDVKRMVTFDY